MSQEQHGTGDREGHTWGRGTGDMDSVGPSRRTEGDGSEDGQMDKGQEWAHKHHGQAQCKDGHKDRRVGRRQTRMGGALTDAAHNALVGDGGHEVWVLLGACVALGPEHAVGILWQGRSPEM